MSRARLASVGVLARLVSVAAIVGLTACTSVHWGRMRTCDAGDDVAAPWRRQEGSLRLVSWNLHGPPTVASMDLRLARVAHVLLEREPDLVLLQEVWFRGDAERLRRALESKYEVVPDESTITQHLLGWLAGFRKSGLLIFWLKTSEWHAAPRSSFRAFTAHASSWKFWQGDGLSTKGVQWVELNRTGLRVLVFNTHLQSPYSKDEDLFGGEYSYLSERRDQVRELLNAMDENGGRGMSIVAGDFNMVPDDLMPEVVGRLTDLTEQYRKTHDGATTIGSDGAPKDWIDYVLARGPWATRQHIRLIANRRADCPYSDHHALEVQLSFQ
jgi:endonuclease/exonuclease/phosphatase family metal-dependent hydrolase